MTRPLWQLRETADMNRNFILVDTSVWINHFREADSQLQALLEEGQVATHPFIVGELALGSIRSRSDVITWLRKLPQLPVANDEEILFFIEDRQLFARGIGLVDAYLLAACLLAGGVRLWTCDKRLAAVAETLGLAVI